MVTTDDKALLNKAV